MLRTKINKVFKFEPFGIAPLTAFSVLQGVCSSLLRLHTLRLENAAKLTIADFRFYIVHENSQDYF